MQNTEPITRLRRIIMKNTASLYKTPNLTRLPLIHEPAIITAGLFGLAVPGPLFALEIGEAPGDVTTSYRSRAWATKKLKAGPLI